MGRERLKLNKYRTIILPRLCQKLQVEILQQKTVNLLVHTTEKDLLSQCIAVAATILKSWHPKRVLKINDNCVTHDLRFVLGMHSNIRYYHKSNIYQCNKGIPKKV